MLAGKEQPSTADYQVDAAPVQDSLTLALTSALAIAESTHHARWWDAACVSRRPTLIPIPARAHRVLLRLLAECFCTRMRRAGDVPLGVWVRRR